MDFDFAIIATGATSFELFKNSGLSCDNQGFMKVNEYLQSVDFPNIFGGGDCICFEPLRDKMFPPKAGVYAVREAPYLMHNLISCLCPSFKLKKYSPQSSALFLLNVCDGTAILSKYKISSHNTLIMALKNKIDAKFMNLFTEENLKKNQPTKNCGL